MVELVTFAVIAGGLSFLGLAKLLTLSKMRERVAWWTRVVYRLGLAPVEDFYKGKIGDHTVKIHAWLEQMSCRIRIWPNGQVLQHARLKKLADNLARESALIATGDLDFDGEVLIKGDEAIVRATLGHHTRDQLLRWLHLGCRVEIGELIIDVPLQLDADAAFQGTMQGLLDLATAIACTEDQVAERLSDNASFDRAAIVRRRCLETLVASFPEAAATQSAIERACSDSDPLNAQLARIFRDRHTTPEAELLRLLAEGPAEVKPWVAYVLGEVGTRDAVELLHLARVAVDPALKKAAIAALSALRARLGESSAGGRLSLAATTIGGELSEAASGGEVSVHKDPV